VNELHGLDTSWTASRLRSRLKHPAILLRGRDKGSSFLDVVTDRLFKIDVFASLHGPNTAQRMPMIWSRTTHHVDVLRIKGLPHVTIDDRTLSGNARNHARLFLANRLVDVYDGSNLDFAALRETFDMIHPPIVQTYHSEPERRIRAFGLAALGGCESR